MKVMILSERGGGVGLACRFARDGHEVLVGTFIDTPPSVGRGLVPRHLNLRYDLRSILRTLALYPSDLVFIDSLRISRFAPLLRTRGFHVIGPSSSSQVLPPPLPEQVQLSGRVIVGETEVIRFEGGAILQHVHNKVLAVALRASSDSPVKVIGLPDCFETSCWKDGEKVWTTQVLIPGVVGALLELVQGDIGSVWRGTPLVASRSFAMSAGIDAEDEEGGLGAVTPEALKHLYPVEGGLEDGKLKGGSSIAFSCGWGISLEEADRRVKRNIDRDSPKGVKVRGRRARELLKFVGG